jgi:hypothetical protein
VTMTAGIRKLVLTAHVTCSAGWLGAIVCYFAISVTAMTSRDPQTIRALYHVMKSVVWLVLLPFDIASLVTGILMGLGTAWGILRHYWVSIKLVLNLVTTAFLLIYTQEIGYFSGIASRMPLSSADMHTLRGADSLAHSVLALVVLLIAMGLAVYKPRGLTQYGRRKQAEEHRGAGRSLTPSP